MPASQPSANRHQPARQLARPASNQPASQQPVHSQQPGRPASEQPPNQPAARQPATEASQPSQPAGLRVRVFVCLSVCLLSGGLFVACFGMVVVWRAGGVACTRGAVVMWSAVAELTCYFAALWWWCCGVYVVLCFVWVVSVLRVFVGGCSTSPPAETRLTVYRRFSIEQ